MRTVKDIVFSTFPDAVNTPTNAPSWNQSKVTGKALKKTNERYYSVSRVKTSEVDADELKRVLTEEGYVVNDLYKHSDSLSVYVNEHKTATRKSNKDLREIMDWMAGEVIA